MAPNVRLKTVEDASPMPSPVTAAPGATIEFATEDIVVDATLVASLLKLAPQDVPELMRSKAITSICERGIDDHEGEYRLSFFFQNRRARLTIDGKGNVLRRSVIDFGGNCTAWVAERPGRFMP
ncbi:DUF6522 family protein [Mesorhizobium sp. A623]